jgi:hypothetical protein
MTKAEAVLVGTLLAAIAERAGTSAHVTWDGDWPDLQERNDIAEAAAQLAQAARKTLGAGISPLDAAKGIGHLLDPRFQRSP